MHSSEPALEVWSRKLHYYLGLYLLLFVWLFSLSGLILNHPGWTFASFWDARRQERYEKPLRPVSGATDLERARDVLAQLGLSGEIEWKAPRKEPGQIVFQARRPGRFYDIQADLAGGVATVAKTTVNGWGSFRGMHAFSGVRAGQPGMQRDWAMTHLWSFAMDAVAVGLAVMVLSGWWMWFRSRRRRLAGLLSLATGLAVCGLFLLV